MPDVTNPESVEHESIIVPRQASQLFGAYLRQELQGPLETIGKPQNQRLFNFIDNLGPSREVKLVRVNGFMEFEFSKEKDETALVANNFTMSKNLTRHFLSAINHHVKNALNVLATFGNETPFKMADTLAPLSDASELKMLRDESGKIKIIPL